jgi:Ca2+-binding RTX toxin-like protein
VQTIDAHTEVNSGAGDDTVNVGTDAPDIGGTLNSINAPLIVHGDAGFDVLNVDDSGDTGANNGILNSNLITGFGMSHGITYMTFEVLNLYLGSGPNGLTIEGTHAGETNIFFGIGDDTVNVKATTGLLNLNMNGGNDTVNVGSNAPGISGTLNAIGDLVTVDGGDDFDIINVDDTGDTGANAGTLDATRLSGFGMGAGAGIEYGMIEQLDISLGQGDDTVSVIGTMAGNGGFDPITLLRTGGGADTVTVDLDAATDGFFSLNTEGGDDDVDARLSSLPLVIFGGDGGDLIRGGSANDIILGDRGRVDYRDSAGTLITRLGIGLAERDPTDPDLDVPLWQTDGVIRPATLVTVRDETTGGTDTIYGNAGQDVLIGGAAGDNVDGGDDRDLIFGDNVSLDRETGHDTNPRYRVLQPGGLIYNNALGGGSADEVLVTADEQPVPGAGAAAWEDFDIEILNHRDADKIAGLNNFGDDHLAGGADDDQIFGQLGDDVIQGDGSIDLGAGAYRDGTSGLLVVSASEENPDEGDGTPHDGDDYIEGNGGNDVIFGNLGQDDIIGGSSTLFSLSGNENLRPDGSDLIFGGAGTDISRNNLGDGSHNADSDMILGDNGNIYRVLNSTTGLPESFNYNDQIVVRAAELIDYTPGGPDWNPNHADNGAGDEIHGESGDDFVYGMSGNDVLFGEGENDDLIGGWGHDWISGGTGQDGVLGDDGRIFTSLNGTPEPLYGIAATTEVNISTPGNIQQAITNPDGQLKKSVDLTPFNPVLDGNELSRPTAANDIIFGGLGSDWLHGGAGDDAISGAEALGGEPPLAEYYDKPFNPGDVLRFDYTTTGEFAEYDEYDPRREIFYGPGAPFAVGSEFILHFAHQEGPLVSDPGALEIFSDGDDKIFGAFGNDWLVGGTVRDNIYGGWGDDLVNADDDHSTNAGLNDGPDTHPTYEDRAFGGAGRDILIANTGGDRLIDWAGEFNSYIVPFAPFGLGTVSRALQPQIAEFLYDLSQSDGADFTLGDGERNGEPFGELGLVRQQDFAWQAQTGAPDDPQPGNIPGGAGDVLRSADFNNAQGSTAGTGFFADSGVFEASAGELRVSAQSLGGDAVAVFHVGDQLPIYYELQASVKMDKANAGWKANAYMIFDYQNEHDFKFVGIDDSINKLVMGHRDASGWHVDKQGVVQGGVKPDKWYNMLVAVNGLTVTLVVDNKEVFQHTYAPRIVNGYAYALNWGMVGMGSDNARGSYDNVRVQILPPQVTLEQTEDFDDGNAALFTGDSQGNWSLDGNSYDVVPVNDLGYSVVDLGPDNLNFNSYLELNVDVNTLETAGLIFDRYGDESFKFAAIDAASQALVIGHFTQSSGWVVDESMSLLIPAGPDFGLALTLKGTTVSVTLNDAVNGGYLGLASHVFNASTVDGNFGLFAKDGSASFDNVNIKTDDQAFSAALVAAGGELLPTENMPALTPEELAPIVASAIEYWRVLGHDVSGIEGINFEISDLPGTLLGLVNEDKVLIDVNAAGHGWFVDPTPLSAEEYALDADGGLTAIVGGAADGRIDLMTVVTHELGHLLGLHHDDSALMDSSLATGTREVSGSVDASAPTNATLSLDQQNILVTSIVEWSEPSIGNSPQSVLPDSVSNTGSVSNQSGAEAPATLVFDEASGEFIEIENAPTVADSTSLSEGEVPGGVQEDWVVYTSADESTEESQALLIDPITAETTTSIDWSADAEEVNDLLPPPPPGRSGMKHVNKSQGAKIS